MELLPTDDPAFLETCHRWLLFHYHCNECGQGEDSCEFGKVCSSGKSAFAHVQGCNRDECGFPRCDLVKKILRHHQSCRNEICKICAPVCKYQARSKQPPPPLPPSSPYAAESSPGSATSSMQASEPPQAQSHSHSQSLQSSELQSAFRSDVGPIQYPQQLISTQLALAQSDASEQSPAGAQAGMLFEARHREQKRHMNGGLARISAPDVYGTATATASGGSMTSAPSGSLDAMAELQALHLDHVPAPPQQQPQKGQQAAALSEAQGHGAIQRQGSAQSPVLMDFQARPGREQTQLQPATPQSQSQHHQQHHQHHHQLMQQPHPSGLLSPAGAPQPNSQTSSMPAFARLGVGLPQNAPPEQQQQQQQQQAHPGIVYGTSQAQPMVLSGQPGQPLSLVAGAHLGLTAMPAQGMGGPQPAAGVAHQQQPLSGSLAHFAAPPMPTAFHLSTQQQQQQQQQAQLQQTTAFTSASSALSAQAGVLQAGPGVQAASSSYMAVPFGATFVQGPQGVQLAPMGAGAPGMSYTVVHHHPMFGPGGLAHQQPQQPAGGLMVSGLAPMQAPPGFFLGGSQAVATLAPFSMGCGPSAADGVGPGSGPTWTFVQHGQQHLLQPHPQHPQLLHGTTGPAGVPAPVLLAPPQMAGAT